jgi:hypothetical protein
MMNYYSNTGSNTNIPLINKYLHLYKMKDDIRRIINFIILLLLY